MLTERDFRDLVQAAVLAPSGHNTQPWRFGHTGDDVIIEPDFSRRLPVVDGDDHALYISLGCAIENMSIAAGRKYLRSELHLEDPKHLRMTLRPGASSEDSDLFAAIAQRQSTRRKFDGRPIPARHFSALRSSAIRPGVSVRFFASPAEFESILPFIKEADAMQFHGRRFKQELVSWIRFNKREARRRRDGLAAESMGVPRGPRWIGATFLSRLMPARSEVSRTAKLVQSSSALALFIAQGNTPQHWIALGQSFERLALTATALGIKHAHVNMPCEVPAVRAKLKAQLGLGEKQEPLLLIRLGYAEPMPRSPRRPIDEVIH